MRRWVLAALAFGVGCEDEIVSGGTSALAVDPLELDLGRVYVGAETQATFEASAPGDLPINFEIALLGDTFGYAVGPAGGRIGANTKTTFTVAFRAGEPGEKLAEVQIDSDAKSTPSAIVKLRAVGLPIPDCEDGNGCTSDRFNLETSKCDHVAEARPCEDLNACTGGD